MASLGMNVYNFNHNLLKHASEAVLPFYVLNETVIVIKEFRMGFLLFSYHLQPKFTQAL